MAEDFQANNWWKTSRNIGGGGDGAPFYWTGGAASQLSSPSMDNWGQTLLSSSSSGRDENSFHQVMLQEDMNSSAQLKDMNHPFFFENSIISSGDNTFPLSSSSSSIIQGLIEPDNYHHSQFINNNTHFWNASSSSQPFDLPIKSSSMPAMKKIRVDQTSSTLPTFKVRKEKLGDRITALQQLVSPFGKTDTASVLHEAIEYIKFLHEQVNVLSTPYLKNDHPMQQQQQRSEKFNDGEWKKKDLRSRGLCLVPISSTYPVATETTADFWTPTFGGNYR